jgi:hypothetical protein
LTVRSRLSQHRRLCTGVNYPPLTHRSRCSPSAQAPSLSSSDELIMPSLISCPVVSILSSLDGDAPVPSFGTQGCRTGNPPKLHAHKGGIKHVARSRQVCICVGCGSNCLNDCLYIRGEEDVYMYIRPAQGIVSWVGKTPLLTL